MSVSDLQASDRIKSRGPKGNEIHGRFGRCAPSRTRGKLHIVVIGDPKRKEARARIEATNIANCERAEWHAWRPGRGAVCRLGDIQEYRALAGVRVVKVRVMSARLRGAGPSRVLRRLAMLAKKALMAMLVDPSTIDMAKDGRAQPFHGLGNSRA